MRLTQFLEELEKVKDKFVWKINSPFYNMRFIRARFKKK